VLTPAEVLAAAAEKLDSLVGKAAPDWRIDADNFLAMPLIETPFMIGPFKDDPERRFGLVGPNDATTVYLWTMRPEVGEALAAWLRHGAADAKEHLVQETQDCPSCPYCGGHGEYLVCERCGNFPDATIAKDRCDCYTSALALARLIIGGKS
jgi:hypothetical protein